MLKAAAESGAQRPLSLYIHIPFCVRKCLYCDFLSGPASEEMRERYVQALCAEIAEAEAPVQDGSAALSPAGSPQGDNGALASAALSRPVDTVFFGGGTPSLLTAGQLERIMEAVRARFAMERDAEISLECNPGTADEGKLRAFRDLGVNRLSLGVQSLCDEELRTLGRIHTAAQAREAYGAARRAGFANINVDLMSALPGQRFSSYEKTVRALCDWEPEHISAYSLIVEEGTPFAGQKLDLPSEDEERAMYRRTKELLAARGYARYEISNYARSGFACRHNVGYWTGHDYLGLGLGASSLVNGVRFRNTDSMERYLAFWEKRADGQVRRERRCDAEQAGGEAGSGYFALKEERPYEEIHVLTTAERMEEFMFLGLRLTGGVSERDFAARFGRPIDAVYGAVLEKQRAQGLLVRENGRVRLTDFGLDVSNYAMAEYLLS